MLFRSVYQVLFGHAINHQLGMNKAQVIESARHFERSALAVSLWCRPLKVLLRKLSVILRKHYEKQEFPMAETYEAFMNALRETEQVLRSSQGAECEEDPAYQAELVRRSADRTDWGLPARVLTNAVAVSEVDEEPAPSPDDVDDFVGDRLDSHKTPGKHRCITPALKALRLVPGPSSPTCSDSAGSVHTATGAADQKRLQISKRPQTRPPNKPQVSKGSSTHTSTTKGVSKKEYAVRSTSVLTRVMKRAASAVPGSSTAPAQSRGVSDTAPAPKNRSGLSMVPTQDGSDEHQVIESTTLDRTGVDSEETRASARRAKGKAREADR